MIPAKPKTAAEKTAYAKQQEKKAEKIARERAIFQMACIRKGLDAATGPATFRVSRQTYWAWMASRRKIPHAAFVRLVELDNQMDPTQWERIKDLERIAEQANLSLFAKPVHPRKRRAKKAEEDKA